jgi:uncharacterized FAD-dependent dehydrogenase
MDSLITRSGSVIGIRSADGQDFLAPVILASGHSARDVYRHLHTIGLPLQPKPIAIGLRLEHPQHLIDSLLYRSPQGRPHLLPPAQYSFAFQVDGRGVYSFCMCPGGFVIPAATAPGQLLLNGMSPARRNSPHANAAIVVELRLEDLPARHTGTLSLMHYQEELERLAFQHGGGCQVAPAQRLTDFCARKTSSSLPPSSYTPGLVSSPLHQWIPSTLSTRIPEAIRRFDRLHKGFLSPQATLIAIETRTSAPLRIPQDPLSGYVLGWPGLFPAGEGAGQAGGIISSALDGQRAAASLAAYLFS